MNHHFTEEQTSEKLNEIETKTNFIRWANVWNVRLKV